MSLPWQKVIPADPDGSLLARTFRPDAAYTATEERTIRAEHQRIANYNTIDVGTARGTDRGGVYGAKNFGFGTPKPTQLDVAAINDIRIKRPDLVPVYHDTGFVGEAKKLATFAAIAAGGYFGASAVFGAPVAAAAGGVAAAAPAVAAAAPVAATAAPIVTATGVTAATGFASMVKPVVALGATVASLVGSARGFKSANNPASLSPLLDIGPTVPAGIVTGALAPGAAAEPGAGVLWVLAAALAAVLLLKGSK